MSTERPHTVGVVNPNTIVNIAQQKKLYAENVTREATTRCVTQSLKLLVFRNLEQGNRRDFKSVAYISRSLTQAEQKCAQIEKVALAFTWASKVALAITC